MATQHSTRHLRRHGEALTVRNYDFGAEDEHGDAERVETTNSPYSTTGHAESATQATAERGLAGTTLDYDVTFYVPEADAQGNDEPFVAGLTGVGGDGPPSQVERDAYGVTFRVVRVHPQGNGILALDARVVA